MMNCNEAKQLADSLVNLLPDDTSRDPGDAVGMLFSWQPPVCALNVASRSLIGLLKTHFLAIRTENIFFHLCERAWPICYVRERLINVDKLPPANLQTGIDF